LSASIARLCSSEGMEVALAARNIDKLVSLKKEINAKTFKKLLLVFFSLAAIKMIIQSILELNF